MATIPPTFRRHWRVRFFEAIGFIELRICRWCFPWAAAALAGTGVCLRRIEAATILELIREHKVTVVETCRRRKLDPWALITEAVANARRGVQTSMLPAPMLPT